MTMTSAISFFQRGRATTTSSAVVTQAEIDDAIAPLYSYFNENFAIMKQTLTDSAMIMVMTRLWKEVLMTIESLLVPPMSDKLSQQKALSEQELDIVFKWLQVSRGMIGSILRVWFGPANVLGASRLAASV
jgi:trans-2-enoyl-CoA reductase